MLSRNIMIKFGFKEKDIDIILNTYPLNSLKDETLSNKIKEIFEFLLSLNYSEENIRKMAKLLPQIFSYDILNIKQKIKDLIDLGYSKEEVMKMTIILPQIFGYNIKSMKQKIKDLINLGYSKDEVIKITKTYPHVYSYSIESMKQKIADIMNLGYSKDEVIKMLKYFPALFGISIESMKQKIVDIINLGYSKDEVIKITCTNPTIYGYSQENIKEKIEFYDSINMHELAIVDSKKIMQSVALSYARYKYYEEKDIVINMKNYSKLFYSEKQFKNINGVEKKQLLEKYDYNEYIKGLKNERFI